MIKMKKVLLILLCLVLCFSLVGCSDAKEPEGDANEPRELTLCLDWTPNTNHTGFYVAAAKGYYADAGLDVSIVQPMEDSAASLLAAGKVDFAITCQDTMVGAFTSEAPLDITAIAALVQHNTSGIISRAEDEIATPKGLEGKTYSTWNTPVELAMMEHVMTLDGGDFSKLALIPNTITDEPGALDAHQTDAIWVFYGWGGITAELRAADKYGFFYFKDIDPVLDYYTPVISAENSFLAENPKLVKAFLDATRKGFEYAIENPEDAAQILIDGDTTGSLKDSSELVLKSQQWMSGQYKAEVEQWGYIDPARWDGFYKWLSDNELVEKPLEPGTGFTNDYLS